jgi:predicted MFS family arabinose efflux permease
MTNKVDRFRQDTAVYSTAYKRYVLGLLLVTYASNFMDRQILSVLLQPIKQELALTDTQLGLLSGIAFALFYATLGIPLARWADRRNRVNLISVCIAIWSGMTALCGLAGNFFHLLAARIGVGIGEAGCSPPAHSMIADYFEPGARGRAMAIYFLGLPMGSFLGYLLGGWINELYGWRVAFFAVGAPGLLLAILVRLTLKEPARGLSDRTATVPAEARPIGETLSALFRNHSYRHLALGTSLVAMTVYGSATWFPAFMMRTHGMSSGEAGTLLALLAAGSGIVGTIIGGFLSDWLGARDNRWYAWVPALATLISVPFSIAALISTSVTWLAILLIPVTLAQVIYAPPVFATVQRLVGLRSRATASAVLLFSANLIGLGLGPLALGVMSDLLNRQFGDDALRFALLSITAIGVWAALHFFLASRSLRADIERAEQATAAC